MDILIRNRCSVAVECTHISLTATTIDIIHYHSCAIHLQQQAFRARHSTLVTATVEVANLTSFQIPTGTDSHVSLVISTKQTTNLEGFAIGVCEGGIDSHLLETSIVKQLATVASVRIRCVKDTTNHLAGIVQTDDGLVCHRGVVTTTVGIDDRTAKNFQVGPFKFGRRERRSAGNDCFISHLVLHYRSVIVRHILIIAVTTAKELTDIDLLGIIGFFAGSIVRLCRDTHKCIPGIVNFVLSRFWAYLRQFGWKVV